jgi:hypothetical protein
MTIVSPTVQLFHRLTDIHESWYGRHAIGGRLNIVICNLLQPATLRPTRLHNVISEKANHHFLLSNI